MPLSGLKIIHTREDLGDVLRGFADEETAVQSDLPQVLM